MRLDQSFTVDHPPVFVWEMFQDVSAVAACLPGAELTEPPVDGAVKGRFVAKLGPITAAFGGDARITRDDAARTGTIVGNGRDGKTGSLAKGEVQFAVKPENEGRTTRVELAVDYTLGGALAQFGRGGIVVELANRITQEFARNLQAAIAARMPPPEPEPVPAPAGGNGIAASAVPPQALRPQSGLPRPASAPAPASLDLGSILWQMLLGRLRRLMFWRRQD